jgi:hypothetical protein
MLDEDYGDITDPLEGRDIKVIVTKQPGRQWAMTEVRPRGKQSKLSTDKNQIKDWIDNIPSLDEMFEEKSYDALTKIINDWINGEEENDSYGTARGSSDSETSSSPSSDDKFKSLDDAFADLEDDF